jgi:hypothetical protein
MKPPNACTCRKVSNIINIAKLLNVSATLLVILREVLDKGWIYQDITEVCEPEYKCKTLSVKNVWF